MGVDERNLQVIDDVEVMLKSYPITILYGTYLDVCSDYGVYNSHYILYYL